MRKLASHLAPTKAASSLFGLRREPGQAIAAIELTELSAAELAIVAGGPEGEVGAGVNPPA